MIKKIATWAGGIVALMSLLINAFGVFVLEREVDDVYRRLTTQDSRIDLLSEDFNDQYTSCEVLEATVSSLKCIYTFDKCKR